MLLLHRRTSAFSPATLGARNHWILEASNIRPATKKALRLCKTLILLAFLAPRPGLEPGTYGLTGYRSICPLTRMNARVSGFVLPIYFVRFTSGRPGKGRSEPLDIGSLESMVFTPVDGRPQRDLERIGAAGQDGLETQIGGFKPGFPRLAVWRRNPDEK